MTLKRKIIIGVIAVLLGVVLIALIADRINSYKEGQFTQRQAELQRQLDTQKIEAGVQKGLADKAAEAGLQKDAEIKQLKEDNAALTQAVEEKRAAYVHSRQPVPVRDFNSNATDADIRAAARRAALIVRPAP